jgi:hypothetical protein
MMEGDDLEDLAWIREASRRQHPCGVEEVARLADLSGLTSGLARSRLLIAHLQHGDLDVAISMCAREIARQRELAALSRELVTHAPPTDRSLRTLASVLAMSAPEHPLAQLQGSGQLWVSPAFDTKRAGDQLEVILPPHAGFPPGFDGILVSTEQPLSRWVLCSVAERINHVTRFDIIEDHGLLIDDFNIASPAILVASETARELPAWAPLLAKLRRGLVRLGMA